MKLLTYKSSIRAFLLPLFIAITLLPVHFCQANNENLKPLNQLISYDDFISLLKFNSRRVPDLQKLWNWTESVQTKDVYWAGGRLRGFMHWHYLQLQSYSAGDLKKMPLPHMDAYDLQPGNDVDFIGPEKLENEARRVLSNIRGVDYILAEEYPELVKLGGATLEKIGINSHGIIDPLNGFKHYYEGKIIFKWALETEFRNSPWVADMDYSKTAEALRFIRFAHFNLPELTVDQESLEHIRRIPSFETTFLNRDDRLAWVTTALKKLIVASKGDIPSVLTLLHKYNLLLFLAERGIMLPSDQIPTYRQWLSTNSYLFNPSELKKLNDALDVTYETTGFIGRCKNALSNFIKKVF